MERDEELSLGRILMFVRRWGLRIFACSVLFGAAGAAIIFSLPRDYSAHFSIFVTGTNSMAATAQVQAQLATLFGLSSGGTEYVMAVLDSDRIQLAVIESVGLMENEDFWWGSTKERTKERALERLRKKITLDGPNPPLMGPVTLTVETISAELSDKIANQFLFLLNQRTERETKSRSTFLQEQLVASREALQKAETELQAFAEAENVVVPLEELGKEEFLAQVTLKTQKILGEIELSALRARTQAPGDMSVQMTLKSEIAGLEAKLSELERSLTLREQMFSKLPQQARRYADLMREFKTREKIFELYLEHYELARLYEVGDAETRPYRVIDTPYLPTTPDKRHGLIKLIVALALGALVGFAGVFFLEALEVARKEERDIKARESSVE